MIVIEPTELRAIRRTTSPSTPSPASARYFGPRIATSAPTSEFIGDVEASARPLAPSLPPSVCRGGPAGFETALRASSTRRPRSHVRHELLPREALRAARVELDAVDASKTSVRRIRLVVPRPVGPGAPDAANDTQCACIRRPTSRNMRRPPSSVSAAPIGRVELLEEGEQLEPVRRVEAEQARHPRCRVEAVEVHRRVPGVPLAHLHAREPEREVAARSRRPVAARAGRDTAA